MRKLDRLKLQRDIAIAEKARTHAEYVLKMDDLNRAIKDMQNDIDNLEAYGDMAVVEADTPQTEKRTDRDGDVWEWRGDAWYCIGQPDTPQTESGWGKPTTVGPDEDKEV